MDQTYEIIDGVRRAKAVHLAGGQTIRARLYDSSTGQFLRQITVSIDCLRSPHKGVIDRSRRSGKVRWQRVVDGARQNPPAFPPIEIQEGSRGVKIEDVSFDLGSTP